MKCCTDSHGCYRVASHYLMRADLKQCEHWLHRGDETAKAPHQINHALHVAFLEASERWAEALTRHKRRFFAQPTEQLLAKLQELAIQANAEAESTAEVERHLQAQLKSPFLAQTAALLLAELAGQRSDTDAAYQYIHEYVTNANELQKAAKDYAQQPSRACELLNLAMEAEIKTKNKRGYRRAVDMLQVAKPLFDALSSTAFLEQATNLRERHRAKRNLMKMLDEP